MYLNSSFERERSKVVNPTPLQQFSYDWTVDYFNLPDRLSIQQTAQTALLYSVVRHPYERSVCSGVEWNL